MKINNNNFLYFIFYTFCVTGLITFITNSSVNTYAASQPEQIHINTEAPAPDKLKGLEDKIALDLKSMDVLEVLKFLAAKGKLNITAGNDVTGRVTLFMSDISIKDALGIIMFNNNLGYIIKHDVIFILSGATYKKLTGKDFNENKIMKVVEIENAPLKDLTALLGEIKSETGKIIINSSTNTVVLIDAPAIVEKMENTIKSVEKSSATIQKIFKLSYSTVEELEANVRDTLTPEIGILKIDKRTNSMIVTDTPKNMKIIKKIIKTFDARLKQVLIEAKIMKIELTNEFETGIDWEILLSSVSELDIKGVFTSSLISPTQAISIGKLPEDTMTATINILETIGKTEILSSPHIMVKNNEEASILVGQIIPVISEVTTTSQGLATSTPSVEYLDLGIKLYVKPSIGEDGYISMTLKPEVSELLGFEESSLGSKFPKRETSEAETTVIVKNGTSIVIGGLIKDDKKTSESKVPLLGDIPLLGMLFKKTSETTTKNELVIFVKPTIITGEGEAEKFAAKKSKPLKNKMGKGTKPTKPKKKKL